jgi:glucose/arabinose dehydrogenase
MRFPNLASPLLALSLAAIPLASCQAAPAQRGSGKAVESAATLLTIEDVATFDEPWAMSFIPGSPYIVITERGGRIKLLDGTGKVYPVRGTPKVDYGGQGGLGDVLVTTGPDVAGWSDFVIYLSWVDAGPNDTRGAVVGRGELVLDEMDGDSRIENLKVIWRQSPKTSGRGHYAHRLALSPDGKHLFVSSGDRQKMTPAQDLGVNLGKVVRLLPDGTPAPGNPFAARGGVSREVWSYGHRNILGLAFDGQNRLWGLEHGPAGGDEVNLIEPGRNYGWPVVSEGDHYNRDSIPRHRTRPDLAAPVISWSPVIAPGDFIIYSGNAFPAWKGQAIVAGMGHRGLVRVAFDGGRAREVERIDLGKRIRDVAQGPDGAIWVLEDKEGARLRKLTLKD